MHYDIAQKFTTSSNSEGKSGYILRSVNVLVSHISKNFAITVGIYASSSEKPGQLLGTLTSPSSISLGINNFAAPITSIELYENTQYWVVVDSDKDSSFSVTSTTSKGEDVGGAFGWRIGDKIRLRLANTNSDWPLISRR